MHDLHRDCIIACHAQVLSSIRSGSFHLVVSVEDLDCLDLIVWLRTGENAAARLVVSQSRVSRAVQTVCDLFGLSLVKSNGEWQVIGDQALLNLERRVHQEHRWRRGLPLRIEAQYYSGPLYCHPIPEDWVAGNFDYLDIHTPLQHLRTGVIDAWIGCYPDVPEASDPEFVCFHLTRLPTHLVVNANHPLLEKGDDITLDDVRRYPSLALVDGAFPKMQALLQELGLWNLPLQLQRYCQQHWEGRVASDLVVGYATAFTMGLFDHAQVILPVQIPLTVGDSLVVRREYASHPILLRLLARSRSKAQHLAASIPDVFLPESIPPER